MRRHIAFFLALSLTWAIALPSHAQAIRDIETTVRLYATGNALVVQTWDVTVVDGTEWYIPIDNLGKSYIHDFRVFENDVEYENDGRKWDSNRSLAAKTHRCGIVEKRRGNIELCWGQGEYGDHVYTIMYIIDNLVQSYDECDGFHWHFLNDEWDVKPQHASITIQNMTEREPWYWAYADSCNVRFWGFGMVGDSRLEDGTIYFESTEPFKYKSFFSALVSFDKGLFLTEALEKGDGSFAKLQKQAMKGSDYKDDDDMSFFEKILFGIFLFIFIGIPLLLIGYAIFALFRRIYRKVSGHHWDKKIFGQSKIDGWWRDIPLNGTPTALYSLLLSGDLLKPDKSKLFSNVVSAYFLKWIQDGWVAVEKDPNKDKRLNLRFVKAGESVEIKDSMEAEVYRSAIIAAGDNQLLEADEFKRWSYLNDRTVTSWPMKAKTEGRKAWSNKSQEERCHAVEFRNFINDFTLASEREVPEVGLWKQYMVMAAALGVADKVSKSFEKLFPKVFEEYAQQTNMLDTATTYTVLRNLNNSSTSMMSSAFSHQAQRRAASAASSTRSHGGGGSISFGGGGGGFGGGHGGGSR
ncbi:MAG: DUF2207 domain-containing protein [Bacteroidales bacterium]|nr:DUF2207 domain-containing protein [Bacteroidales bacterium]